MTSEDKSLVPDFGITSKNIDPVDANLRQIIESKFGPIPEFSQAVWEKTANVEDIRFTFNEIRYIFRYHPDQELLEFVDQVRGSMSLDFWYKLIDPATKTATRRSLSFFGEGYPGEVPGKLHMATVSFRLPNMMQNYNFSSDSNPYGDNLSVNFTYGEGFSRFDVGSMIGTPLAQIYYKSKDPVRPRTDIEMPLDSMETVRKLSKENGYYPFRGGNTVHVYFFEEGNDEPGPIHIVHPKKKNQGYPGQNNYGTLSSEVLYTNPDLAPETFTMALGDDAIKIDFTKPGKHPELWNLQLPRYANFQPTLSQVLGDDWANLYKTFPVRLNISETSQLPEPEDTNRWNLKRLMWWKS